MSSEGMDSNPEILEQEAGATAMDAGAREWPGVSREGSSAGVKFPGEDGGRSLGKMAERDLDAALQLLAERAQYITGATGAAIALRDGEEMVCRASAGGSAPEIGARLQMNSGLSGESIQTRQLLRCDDAQTDGRVNKESCEALGIASVIVMPMVDGGEVIGVFELFSDRAYAFEDRDITALERMGAMVRTAIEQVEAVASADGEQRLVDHGAPTIPSEPEMENTVESAEPIASSSAAQVEELTSTFEEPVAPSFIMHAEEEIEERAAAFSVGPDSGEVETVEIAEETPASVAGPGTEEASGESVEDNSLFLSTPETSTSAPTEEIRKKAETVDREVETDIGEMARDAAARTAAFKASLFAQDAPAATTEARPERVAFHMRVPARKIEPPPVEAMPAALANTLEAKAAETKVAEAQKPGVADQRIGEPAIARPILATPVIAKPILATPVIAEVEKSESQTSLKETVAASAAPVTATAAVTNGGAAVAPAREMAAKAIGAKVEKAHSTAAADAAVKPATELTKAKVELTRPASAEGRSKIAVSQVRKCEACGFPVSEGRKLCLDCEKKKPKDATASEKTATPVPAAVAPISKTETVVAQTVEVKAEAGAFVVPEPIAQAEIEMKVSPAGLVEEKAVEAESKTSEAAPAARASFAEPPAPQFMVSEPDRYESWIVSHMYTAVAAAILLVGIVVYLLSR